LKGEAFSWNRENWSNLGFFYKRVGSLNLRIWCFGLKWLKVVAVIACLMLLGLPLAASAERNPPFVISSVSRGVVTVSNYYYTVKLDFNKGVSVSSWVVVLPNGSKVELLRLGSIIPSILLNAFVNRSSGYYEFTYNGSTARIPLSTLAFKPWSFEVVSNTTDLLSIRAKPGDEALVDVKPLVVTAVIKARIWSPSLEYTITFINPSNETITLRGPDGGPEIVVVVDDGVPGNWILSLADTGLGYLGGTAEVKPGEPVRSFNLEAVTLVRLANATDKASAIYFAGLKPIQPLSYTILYQVGVKAGDLSLDTPVILRLIADPITLKPNDVFELKFNIAYVYREPMVLAQSGLEPAAIVVDSNVLGRIIGLYNFEDYIRNATKPLQDRMRELEGNISKLESRVRELEGLKSFWENEISIKESQVNSLRSQISRQNLVSLGLLALGLVLGFSGGFLATRFRREELPVRRKERRR